MNRRLQVPKTTIYEGLKENALFIDVRSPKEFEEFQIPGAMNIPLFNNEERIQIGTIYKQEGKEQAKDLGIKILSTKLPQLYDYFKNVHQNNKNKSLIIYCWRGGMRSFSIVSVMSMMGLPVMQLTGGIRSFRRIVVSSFEEHINTSKKFIVLEGLTGTRKTEILDELEKEGYPVINIEGIANHRGSVFGGIGLSPVTQKEFEARLWSRLEELKDSPYFIIEAESKRIGNLIVPHLILTGKEAGFRIHIDADMNFRVHTICKTYSFEKFHNEFRDALLVLKKRIPNELFSYILASFDNRDYPNFVLLILKEYYDPSYKHSFNQRKEKSINIHITSLAEGVDLVKQKITDIQESFLDQDNVSF